MKAAVAATAIAVVSCLLLPVAARQGSSATSADGTTADAATVTQRNSGFTQLPVVGRASRRNVEAFAGRPLAELVDDATGSQLTYLRITDGFHTGTANERFARPALSLAKLYIADYVLRHGTETDRDAAVTMLETSDDAIADRLFGTYPDSIDEVAARYNLQSTRGNGYWGNSVTSTYDLVSFLAQKRVDDPASALFAAMANADAVAADGYAQDFGTSTLPGVLGTKWGWSDEENLHSSVSFGTDFIIAAAVAGTKRDLTNLVAHQMSH